MTRLHADPVEVQREDTGSGHDPAQFLWRGRLYLVREVLARWTQSGSWWRGTHVHDLVSGTATTASATETAVDDREQQWWRVEADSGRLAELSGGPGVYDLCFEESSCSWSLKRVLD